MRVRRCCLVLRPTTSLSGRTKSSLDHSSDFRSSHLPFVFYQLFRHLDAWHLSFRLIRVTRVTWKTGKSWGILKWSEKSWGQLKKRINETISIRHICTIRSGFTLNFFFTRCNHIIPHLLQRQFIKC